MKVFVIAEAGISHDGDIRIALDLIDRARDAGADAVKFQVFRANALAVSRKKKSIAAALKRYQIPYSWLPILREHCDTKGIEFMATCFDEEGLIATEPYLKRFKIGSAEATNERFVSLHYGLKKPVIISCGMNPKRYRKPDTYWLHCVSKYPCSPEEAELWKIREHGLDGWSDHTAKCHMGAFAVAAGARIVEVHFRSVSTGESNPDFKTSLLPEELRRYVQWVRLAEQAVYGTSEGWTIFEERQPLFHRPSRHTKKA